MRVSLLVGATLLASASIASTPSMSMSVSPAHSFEPANLIIRFRIEPSPDNWALAVVADSETFYRSSAVSLEGERAPRTILVQFRSVPNGNYTVSGTLTNQRGQMIAVVEQEVEVIPSGR